MRLSVFLTGLVLLLSSINLFAQQERKLLPFKLDGTINADSGTVMLELLRDKDYHPKGVESITARVENGTFSFSGFLPYPQGVTISYGEAYYSDLFIIDPGSQSIACDVYARREVPKVDNASMKEFAEEYTPAFVAVRQKIDGLYSRMDSLSRLSADKESSEVRVAMQLELKRYYMESDSIRLAYAQTYPDSYVALWHFINLFSLFGYENHFESIYAQFSELIKETHTGRVLGHKLGVASKLAIGKPFPVFAAVDLYDKGLSSDAFTKNTYTLVDFWYSNCSPCIAQFPHLKELYESYRSSGFEIIAISTDKFKYKQHWQKAILKHQLLWPQFWDQDGTEASKLSINKFPTNFLLDKQGNIIGKDLRPVELEQFLKENL
jgi:thiol-disulfide isomerase/thioredoxin